MSLWATWLELISTLLNGLASEVGLGLGLAIIVATVLLRAALLPISWTMAYRGCIRQKKLMKLRPELDAIRERHAENPEAYMQKMMGLYRRNDLTLIDGKSLIAALAQMPLFLGMFHALRAAGEGVRFLWIENLARPDFWLAIIAGVSTALIMMANPDLPEQLRIIMLIVPSIVIIVAALKLSSALAIYWATSNCFSALQTVVLHAVVGRRIASGKLRI